MSSYGRPMMDAAAMSDCVANAADESALADHEILASTGPLAWDPHEIWLRRIQQPRERAARLARKVAA